MSEVVGSLGIELRLERAKYDRQIKALQTEKGGVVNFAASLDTRALRRQIENISRATPTISINARIGNLNALEGQLKTFTRDRSINVGVRLNERTINQQLQTLTQSRIVRLQAALINSTAIDRQIGELTRDRVIRVGIEIDDRGLTQKLSRFVNQGFKVTAQVDDSRLTALNKHLDLKQKHFGQVNNYFASRPLTPKTDLSYLDALGKRLDDFKNSSIDIRINVADVQRQIADLRSQLSSLNIPVTVRNASSQSVTQKVTADTSLIEQNITKALNNSFKGLEKNVTNAFSKIGKGNILGGIGDILTAPLRLAGDALAGVAKGAVFGIGEQITKELGQGIGQGIENELSDMIGSFKLIGKTLGQGLAEDLSNALEEDLQGFEQALKDILGDAAIATEGAAVRSRSTKESRETQQQAFDQTRAEFGNVQRNRNQFLERQANLEQRRTTVNQKSQDLRQRIEVRAESLGAGKLRDRAKQNEQRRDQISEEIATVSDDPAKVAALRKELTELADTYSDINRELVEVTRSARQSFAAEIDALKAESSQLYVDQRRFARDTASGRNIKLVNAPETMRQSRPNATQEAQSFYEQTFREVAKRSGVSLDRLEMPKLVASSELPATANAAYDSSNNQVLVSQAQFDAIQSGATNEKQFETLVHELRHSIQEMAGDQIQFMNPSATEARKLGSRIEASVAGGSLDPTTGRRNESDAYVFAERNAAMIRGNVARQQAMARFTDRVGVGGGKAEEEAAIFTNRALKVLKGIQDSASVDIGDELSGTLKQIEQFRKNFTAVLDRVPELESLTADEIDQLIAEIEQTKQQFIENSFRELDSLKSGVVSKPEKVRSQLSDSLSQFNRKKDLVPLAQEFGIENADQLNKKQLIEQLTNNADLRALQPRVNQMTQTRAQQQLARQERIQAAAQTTGRIARGTVETGRSVFGKLRAAADSEVAQGILNAGANTIRGLAAAGKATYKLASIAESVALDMVPMGNTIKGVLRQTAVPALAYGAATHLLPGGGMVAEGANHLMQGALSPVVQGGADALTGQVTGMIQQIVPNALGMQAHATSAASELIQGGVGAVTEMLVNAGTVIVGGKVLQGTVGKAANTAMKSALPPDSSKALPPAQSKAPALPPATTEPQAEIVANPFEGLTRPQLLAASRKLGIQGVNSKTTKDVLESRLKSYRDQGEVDRILEQVRSDVGRDGKPVAGVGKKAEAATIKRLAKAEKDVNKKIAQLASATGKKREKLINEILERTQNAIAQIDQLKGQNLSGETVRSLSGIQGRLENSYRNNPTLNDARNERIQTGRDAAIQSANQRNITGLARVAIPEQEAATFGKTIREGFRRLTNLAAKQFDVQPQPTIKGTLGAIAKSPKARDLATDLAVNGAGFAASKLGAQYGIVPELTGDLVGALAMRQALSRGRASGKDLTGDISGFAIGNGFANLANAGLDALTGIVPGAGVLRSVPFKGALAASAVVPKVTKATEKFQQPEGLARVGSGGLLERFKSLLPNNQKKADRLKTNYENIYREIAKLSGVAFDPKNLPKLSINPARLKQMGADAFYDIEQNTIVIDQSLAQILSGRANTLRRNAEKIKSLVHEGRHSVQLNQGQLNLEQAATGQAVRLMNGRNLSDRQRQQVDRSVEVARRQGASADQLNVARALETDAYAFENRTGEVLSGLARTPQRGLLSRVRDRFRPKARASNAGRMGMLETEIATSRVGSAEDLSKLTDPDAVRAVSNAANSSDRFDAAAARIQAQQDRTFSKVADPLKASGGFKQKAAQQAKEYADAFIGGLRGLSGAVPIAERALRGLFSGGIKEGLGSLNEGFKGLLKNSGLLIKGFLGFAVLSTIAPAMQQFASQSLQAAIALDKVRNALNFSTGGKAAEALKTVGAEAERLGIPLQSAQQGYSKLLASTRGTSLQGKASEDLFKGLNAASTVLGLGDEEYSGSILALSQMASKGKVQAEELRGQLGERIPGAFGIASRSLGISEAELNKQLELGAVSGQDFLPKFARQLQVEFGGAAESASGGTQASLNRLNNSVLKTQQAMGAMFTPAISAGANVLSKVVELLANNLDKVAIAALAVAFRMTGIGSINLKGAIAQVLGLGGALEGVTAKGVALQVLKLAGTFALIAAAAESVRSFGEIFALDEVGQGFKTLGDQGEAGMNRIAEAARKAAGIVDEVSKKPSKSKGFDFSFGLLKAFGLEDSGISLKSDDYLKTIRSIPGVEGLRQGVSKLTGGRFTPGTTVEELQQQKRQIEAARSSLQTTDVVNQVYSGQIALRDKDGNAIKDAQGRSSIDIRDSLRQASEIDKRVSAKQNERNRLAAQPKADKKAISDIDSEIRRLNEQRSVVTNPVTELQSTIQGQISGARNQLQKEGITGDEKRNLENEIASLEKAQAELNKIQSGLGTAADKATAFVTALTEMNIQLEQIDREVDIKFNANSTKDLKAQLANFATDENSSLNASVNAARNQSVASDERLSRKRGVLEGINQQINDPSNADKISALTTSSGRSITKDSNIVELEDAKKRAEGDTTRTRLAELLIDRQKALGDINGFEKQAATDRIAIAQAEFDRKMGLIEKEAQKRELANRKSINREQISLINKQKDKSISEEDVAIESAKIAGEQANADLSNAQTQLEDLNAAFNAKQISREQFDQKRLELEGRISDLTVRKAQEELNLREAINRKILEGFERRNRIANARIDASSSDAIANIRTTQLNGGMVGEGGQTEIAKVELQAAQQKQALKQQELAEVQKLRDQKVLSEKEAADRTLAIEQELRDARSRIIDLQVQQRLNAIQSESDARKRAIDVQIREIEKLKAADDLANASLERRKQLLESQSKLSQATSDLRQSSLKIGVDRASEAGDLQKSLRDGSLGTNSARVARSQLGELGFSGGNELQTLAAKQALEAEMDAEKLAALQQQQQLERESLKLQFELEKIAARRALNEAKIAENKALQNAIDAQSELQKAKISGDANQIANAQSAVVTANDGISLAKQGVQIAQENNAALADRLKLEQQINDANQQREQNELTAQNGANRRTRERDFATLQDQIGNNPGGAGGGIGGGISGGGLSGGSSGGGGTPQGRTVRSMNLTGADIEASRRGSQAIQYAVKNGFDRKGQEEGVLRALQTTSGRDREFAMAAASDMGYGNIVEALSKIENAQKTADPSQRISIESELMRANFSSDVVDAITKLGSQIEQLASRPSNVSISTPTPVDDYADFMNRQSGSALRGL